MRLNAKGTVGSFGGRKLIYNKIIIRPPRSASACIGNEGLLSLAIECGSH